MEPEVKIGKESTGDQGFRDFFRSSRVRIFSRIASMMNSERLRYARSGISEIRCSIVAIISSGIETVVYPFVMSMLYLTPKLCFLSDVHATYHGSYIYQRGICDV